MTFCFSDLWRFFYKSVFPVTPLKREIIIHEMRWISGWIEMVHNEVGINLHTGRIWEHRFTYYAKWQRQKNTVMHNQLYHPQLVKPSNFLHEMVCTICNNARNLWSLNCLRSSSKELTSLKSTGAKDFPEKPSLPISNYLLIFEKYLLNLQPWWKCWLKMIFNPQQVLDL